MSDQNGGGGNVLQEAIIALRYKLENEQAYKDFQKAMSALGGAGGSKKTSASVEVSISGLDALKKLRKDLKELSSKVGVSVSSSTPRAGRGGRAQNQSTEFVGPPRPVPITRQQQSSTGYGGLSPINRGAPLPSGNAPVITAEQIKELGSAAKAAAEALRNGARNAAAGLNPSQLRGAIDSSARSLIGSRGRFDPYAADANLDRAHAAGNFSSLRFNPAAPDMSRMSFSPAQVTRSSRVRIPTPDMTSFKRAIENLRQYVGRAGKEMQQRLNIEPRVKEGSMKGGLQNAMTQLGVGAMAVGFGHVLDEAQHLQDQIRALTPTIAEATAAQKGLFEASKDTNSSYKTAVDIYSALAVMKDKTKLDPSQAVEVVRSIQAASQIGGGSAAGQERAIAQVEKAIAMNKLTVIGLNSIERQSRGITVALAEGLGVTVADLRKMAHEGKIGAEEISQALLKMAPEMQKRLGKVRVTFGNLKNFANTVMLEWSTRLSDNWDGWGKGMQGVRNAMAGLNSFMVGAFDKLTSVLGSGENAAKAVQYAFMALGGGAVLAAVWAFGGAVLAALWPVVVAAGAVFTAIVAIDDILGWIAGKKSVMGDLVGPFESFKPVIDEISQSFNQLGSAWSGLWDGSDGMQDALNSGGEPPLAKSLKAMLQDINSIIESTQHLLELLKALQNGDYSSADKAAGYLIDPERAKDGVPASYAFDEMLWGDDPRNGWAKYFIRATDWVSGTVTPSRSELRAQQMQQSSSITNSPTVNVYAQSNEPSEIAKQTSTAVTNAMRIPMLPNAERGPR